MSDPCLTPEHEQPIRMASKPHDPVDCRVGNGGGMTARFTWRREPHQPNRASWGRERGWELRYKRQTVGAVYPRYELGNGMLSGWYWSSRNQTLGIPLRNTASEPVATADEAKAACLAYVQEQLKRGDCSVLD